MNTEAHFTLKLKSHGDNAEATINAAWDELIDFIKELDKSFGSTCSVELHKRMSNGIFYRKAKE